MNETGPFDPKMLKALFARLVRKVGTQEAAAHYLGVSRQYVGYLASANPEYAAYVPSWDHVWTLEQACQESVVFGGFAAMVRPTEPARDASALRETHDVFRLAADLGPLAVAVENSEPGSLEAFENALDALKREAREARAAARVTVLRGSA